MQNMVINRPADTPLRETVVEGTPSQAPSTGTEDALRVMDLSKTFRSGFLKRRIRGIEGVSFVVPRGSVFALLGHNGAGKTTTINSILDLVHADGGVVEIFGQDHRQKSARARLGYLPERPYFFDHLTGRELLQFAAQLLAVPSADRRDRIDSVLARTGMTASADRRLRKYSKGMLQRIGLAQTLVGDPDLFILDEPMSGLDPMGRREVRDLLLELKGQGKTIILSSHIVPDVEMLADQVGIMCEGKLVLTRNLADLDEGGCYKVNLRNTSQGEAVTSTLVDEVESLRTLLEDCHRTGVQVVSVETHRTGLEDVFLRANNRTETAS